MIGYGFIHLCLCAIVMLWPDVVFDTRKGALLLPIIVFGPMAFGMEEYWRRRRKTRKSNSSPPDEARLKDDTE